MLLQRIVILQFVSLLASAFVLRGASFARLQSSRGGCKVITNCTLGTIDYFETKKAVLGDINISKSLARYPCSFINSLSQVKSQMLPHMQLPLTTKLFQSFKFAASFLDELHYYTCKEDTSGTTSMTLLGLALSFRITAKIDGDNQMRQVNPSYLAIKLLASEPHVLETFPLESVIGDADQFSRVGGMIVSLEDLHQFLVIARDAFSPCVRSYCETMQRWKYCAQSTKVKPSL